MNPFDRTRMYYRRYGLLGSLQRLVRAPSKVKRLFSNTPPHFYHLERRVSDDRIIEFVSKLTAERPETVQGYLDELHANDSFRTAVEAGFGASEQRPSELHRNWREALYVLCRIARPETVVETGVHDGLSSAYILEALAANEKGRLISIDTNDTLYIPTDIEDRRAGWIVPDLLYDRWDLRYGDAKEVLPGLVNTTTINVFVHDSRHTEDHMRFEFETARKAMGPGDYLVSDNVMLNDAFGDFADRKLERVCHLDNTTEPVTYEGRTVNDLLGAGVIR